MRVFWLPLLPIPLMLLALRVKKCPSGSWPAAIRAAVAIAIARRIAQRLGRNLAALVERSERIGRLDLTAPPP